MKNRRVVLTGMGMVTPLGLNTRDTWANLLEGKSGITRIDRFDPEKFASKISGSIKGFDPSVFLGPKEVRKTDLFLQYALSAAIEAIEDSGLDPSKEDPARMGVAVGSGIGGIPLIEKCHVDYMEHGPRRISPFFIPGVIINMAAGTLAIRYGFKGPNISIVTACTTGTHNIGHAARMINYGDADVMLAGGSEMATSPMGIGGFSSMRALSTRNDDPASASRPWDKDRDGFVLADGAGVVLLEEYEHAKKRGATIYAELAGFGMSCDAFHMTLPSPAGPVAAMLNAISDAGLNVSDVDYINAHGTSTPPGDKNEAHSIQEAFGNSLDKLLVSSTKSMLGHQLGAAGAVEAILSVMSLKHNVVPPTINLHETDEDYGIDFVPNTAREADLKVTLSNSFGFGGTNGSLVFTEV